MQLAAQPTAAIAAKAKEMTERYSGRLIHLLSFVPDDKLTWSPSISTRSALRIVAHNALTNSMFADVVSGTLPADLPTVPEFFESIHAAEHTYTTRDAAVAALEDATRRLCTAMEGVTAAGIESEANSVFGPMPMTFWLELPPLHMAGHAGQIELLQTMWDDMDNHMG